MALKRGSVSGKFVMVDGLDGSGKGTIVDGLKKWADKRSLRVFDLREYCKQYGELPESDEWESYDVILSAEPTYAAVGKAIRNELINDDTGRTYSGRITAQAFSLDRKILYKKVILPALDAGKHVFQERGLVTSLVYQPIQLEDLSIGEIASLPGNQFALDNAPDLLILTMIDPEEAMQRLLERAHKRDNAIFEKLEFQQKVKERYTSDWLRELFQKNGSKVVYFSTSAPMTPQDTQDEAIKLFEKFLRDDPSEILLH